MKMTLQEKAVILNIQYILESLIEQYQDAPCDSERYRIKLALLDVINDANISLRKLKSYMKLDEQKFEPFIRLLANVKDTNLSNLNQGHTSESQVDSIMPQGIYIYARRP